MPKIVDHQQRKELLAEAAWRVIQQDGLDGLSVRRVADEANLSLGALRHYFDTVDELLAFSMRLVSQRANARIESLSFTGNARVDIEMVIHELIPLDEVRLAEARVWLAFAGKAVSSPAIRALSLEVHEELYSGFRRSIDVLVSAQLVDAGIDVELETKALHAFVDGLVVHCATFPERVPQEQAKRMVSYYLDGLFKS
ncbi:TetR family transcriptional regulator C-terminal domain-containing protein [Paenibacillus sp. CCS19]|uniref:TetR/AcrR family transcriptional regulator n=1 Tax=Paenibacillus sp. CCS19 TaxID=3158387 RepID=UPI00295E3C2B|nr:TetR family transcriptional regulator C-terminal domain-containing protein [Paenibacillus cellulosilyticus]